MFRTKPGGSRRPEIITVDPAEEMFWEIVSLISGIGLVYVMSLLGS